MIFRTRCCTIRSGRWCNLTVNARTFESFSTTLVASAISAIALWTSSIAVAEGLHAREAAEFAAQPGKVVHIEAGSFAVEVRAVRADCIQILVDGEAQSTSGFFERHWLDRNRPSFSDSPTRLEVVVPSDPTAAYTRGQYFLRGTIRVTLPAFCHLEVDNTVGSVTVSGDLPFDSSVRIATTAGRVMLLNAARDVVVSTGSGAVQLGGPGSEWSGTKSTDHVSWRGCNRRVDIVTRSGAVTMENICGGLSVTGGSGAVSAAWSAEPEVQYLAVRTGAGDITISVPRGFSLRGTASTATLDSRLIESDFAGRWDDRHRRLQLRTDGASFPFLAHTVTGHINLTVR